MNALNQAGVSVGVATSPTNQQGIATLAIQASGITSLVIYGGGNEGLLIVPCIDQKIAGKPTNPTKLEKG
jgi:hypothetical protein